MKLQGVFLPIITPFWEDRVDYESYRKLIDYYIPMGIAGLIPMGTTGESPTLDEEEFSEIVEKTVEYTHGRVPIYVGLGGNDTRKVVKHLKVLEKYPVEGILSVSPYYNRPDQNGIYQHFLQISEATKLKIIIYNIPYRTGRNIENQTIYKLAELKNVIGLKDSCGDFKQSMDLLLDPPPGLDILTGEDMLYYSTLLLGGSGGILASAHLATKIFVRIFELAGANDHQTALKEWKTIASFIPFLFMEPNPAPLKYCLAKMGLIRSASVRLPITPISKGLEQKLDQFLPR